MVIANGNGNGDAPLWLKGARAVAYLGAPTVISLFLVWYTTTRIDHLLEIRGAEHAALQNALDAHLAVDEQALQIIGNRLRVICLNSATSVAALDACNEGTDAREYWQRLRRERAPKTGEK